jgi:2-oxoglutarate dehydrogenase E2 component (dihydrolipoamide succinyltransferase)
MARFELKLPRMGESIAEATLTNWLKNVGDTIEADEIVIEVATDKVDNEVQSEVSGVLVEQLFQKDDVILVDQTYAIIETDAVDTDAVEPFEPLIDSIKAFEESINNSKELIQPFEINEIKGTNKFLSPLVKNIAKAEGISNDELNRIEGTGKENRITKSDILSFVENRKITQTTPSKQEKIAQLPTPVSINAGDEIVEMDRMRKLISGYMVASLQTSAHVQSFVEVDVTNIVKWRDKVKTEFEKREGQKLTFTPIFMEAVAKALKDFPGMNISVDGDTIIKKKNINLGMAAALPNGNLIVPVIKNADQLNLVGMAKAVNDLGNRAKTGKLKPDDTQGGTYTVTNIGSFGSVFGTPIINQPEVGILALGAIRKVPAVIETPDGDFIGIRQKMFLTHSYDHRVVDGALGGNFVKRVADYLEAWDISRIF